nr:hypothetical protein [Tanacetum cinerariifolium]
AADSGPIFDTEPVQKLSNNDNYNVFAIDTEHPEQSEFIHDTYLIAQDEHNVIIDSLDMSYYREQIDQNDDDNDLANERELLASLIEKLKCEIDDSKNRNIFLETSNKDETSPILKTFVTGIENQLSLKVKIIRSDNRTKFKNKDLNQFCGMKGIKREFSVPRTSQQNGIAKRKNRTLIKAARTMLADSLLPIPFWAEAVNTACYVQNRVLVTKPHNKTPYELLLDRTPSIGVQEQFDAEKEGEENVQQYMLFPLWSFDSKDPQKTDGIATFEVKEPEFEVEKPESEVHVSPSSSAKTKKHDDKTKREAKGKSPVELSTRYRNLSEEFEDFFDNSINEVNAASTLVPAVGQISTNITNTFSATGPSNTAISPTLRESSYVNPSQYLDDPNMPALEDITYSDDEEDVGAEADFTNLETTITVSPIPTTRVHKDHLVTKIIGDLSSATQTRSMTRMVNDQGGLTRINNEDFHTYMFACFLLSEEPKRVHQALKDPSWIEAIQVELLQFKMQKVWVLVDLPNGKRAIGFKDPDYLDNVNKVVKALYGLHKAPRAWYETLANYLLDNGFQRGKIDQTLFIKKQKGDILLVQVYVDDIIFGLQVKQKQDEIFINQDKYVAKILRKFGLIDGKSASTPIDTEKPLLKDHDGEDVDTTIAVKTVNDVIRLQALVDKKKVVVTEATIREALYFDDAEDVECLPNEEIFIELARMGYEKPSTKLTFYKAFFSSQWKKQVGDLSTHTTKYTSSALTQKVFANMQRVGKGFSGVETPLFEGMLVEQQVVAEGDAEVHGEEVNVGDATEGDVNVRIPMNLLQEVMDTCISLTRRVKHLEFDKVAQALEITRLKRRVKKLERRNKVKEDKTEPAEVQEVVDVVTTAKLITKVVAAASETITAASITITAAE